MPLKFLKPLPFAAYKVWMAAIILSMVLVIQEYTSYLINQFTFDFSWFSLSVKTLANFSIWALLATFVNARAYDFLSVRKIKISRVSFTIVISLITAFFHRSLVLLVFSLAYFIKSGSSINLFTQSNMASLGAGFISSLIQYWVFLGFFLAFGYYSALQQKESELNKAQLNALKMQLHPHFLFNTLHAISSLMDYNVKAAQKMLTRLGYLMRSMLEQDQKLFSTLEDEMNYIQNYLAIEQERFQDRLSIEYNISEKVLDAEIPNLILQPLVENAIKHGISGMKEAGKISISADKDEHNPERLQLSVVDNGKAGQEPNQNSQGIGLQNVAKRLKQIYRDDFLFDHGRDTGNGYRVLINIPYIKTSN